MVRRHSAAHGAAAASVFRFASAGKAVKIEVKRGRLTVTPLTEAALRIGRNIRVVES